MKIAFISRHPAPYRDPVMARLGKTKELDVDLFNECSKHLDHAFWDIKEHGYVARALYPDGAGVLRRFFHLLFHFVFGKYDFVLFSVFLSPEMTAAIFMAALLGRKYGFTPDTVKDVNQGGLRHIIKKFIAKRASLIFVPGEAGVNFWMKYYGVRRERLLKGAYALDGEQLGKSFSKARESRNAIRAEYGISPDDVVFLMVANMIPSRHYPITTKAFSEFAKGRNGIKFMIVGQGPEGPLMKEYAKQHPEIITLDGISFEKMLSLYAISDVYVHGGTEPASTALVIGAIAGMPLISSYAVGCSADVLKDGETGIAVADYLSIENWTSAFGRMLELRQGWREMGGMASQLARALDAATVSEKFIQSVRLICMDKK